MRNDLLADIVTVLGGTVTDSNNRNLLLNDWLTAVKTPQTEQWVAQLDGATQYWQFDVPVQADSASDFELIIKAETSNNYTSGTEVYIAGTIGGNLFLMYRTSNDRIRFQIPFSGGSNYYSIAADQLDAGFLNLKFSRVGSDYYLYVNDASVIMQGDLGAVEVYTLGSSAGGALYYSGIIVDFSFKEDGVKINEIPLTNKAQGATQLATVGNINAFMPNYTEAVWRKP